MKGSAAHNKKVNRRLPYNAELLMGGILKPGIDTGDIRPYFLRARTAKLVGFMGLLRGIELAALELRDVAASSPGGVEYVRIFIRNSKTGLSDVWGVQGFKHRKSPPLPIKPNGHSVGNSGGGVYYDQIARR